MTVCVIIVKPNESTFASGISWWFSGFLEPFRRRRRRGWTGSVTRGRGQRVASTQQRVKRLAGEADGRAAGARVTVMETRGWPVEIKGTAVRSGPAARDSCLPGWWEPLARQEFVSVSRRTYPSWCHLIPSCALPHDRGPLRATRFAGGNGRVTRSLRIDRPIEDRRTFAGALDRARSTRGLFRNALTSGNTDR